MNLYRKQIVLSAAQVGLLLLLCIVYYFCLFFCSEERELFKNSI